MQDYRFIIIIFGEKHIGMLLTNLYSLARNVPGSRVSVFWQDISSGIKNDFREAFPGIDFIDTNFDFSSDEIKRISSKTFMWNHAAKKFKNSNLCFIDVDMLVIKDISKFFDYAFDILFTYKNDRFPLNTGILFCRGNNFEIFFEKWLKETLLILNNNQLLSRAISVKYPFGGADQMSFYRILNYSKGVDKYELNLDNKKIIFKGVPCDILNETTSTKIKDTTHIIHYKGGWQPILLMGKGFTKNRPKKESWEMYLLYLKTHKMALECFNKSLNKNYKLGSFGIKIPFYLSKIDFKENEPKYAIFYFFSCLGKVLDNMILLWKKYVLIKYNNKQYAEK
ncbi:MAG: hypothetical protein V1804_04575 [Patescibacteria group bacterium]